MGQAYFFPEESSSIFSWHEEMVGKRVNIRRR
jgi:hypothetical protein